MNIEDLRKRIDEIDHKLVELLNERTRHAVEIGKIKRDLGEEVYAPEREETVFKRVANASRGPLGEKSLRPIWREIMSAALGLQKDMVVAVFGGAGGFTDSSARQKFGGSVTYKYQATMSDVFRAVKEGRADCGVVPIEDSSGGVTTHVCDLLMKSTLKVCAEIILPVAGTLNPGLVPARFLVIGRKSAAHTGNDRTAILFALPDRIGALRSALAAFEKHGVNVINIGSRPIKGKAGRDVFFVDVAGHTSDTMIQKAVAELKRRSVFMKIVGSYPNQGL